MATVYTVLATPDRHGNREEIGSFQRRDDAELARVEHEIYLEEMYQPRQRGDA